SGTIIVDGHDIITDYRSARTLIGLVPQEMALAIFETVRATVSLSRGIFGRPPNPAFVEKVLKELSLWDKRDSMVMQLSGGMKRRGVLAQRLAQLTPPL